jgi:hypothetical protein
MFDRPNGGNRMDDVEFSILVGRVSTEDSRRILETLAALRSQSGDARYQVVIADRLQDDLTERLARDFPEVVLIRCPREAALPTIRAEALAQARGRFLVVTEDHCVPAPGWLAAFRAAFANAPEETLAVGGCVENGVDGTALDWATFLCEYAGALAPVEEGPAADLPGMNVAYRREAFDGVDPALLRKGFWETTLHPVLRDRGILFSTNAVRLHHCKKFSLALFCRQRYVYSRYYAGIRFASEARAKRAAAAAATLALPPLLLWRIARSLLAKRRRGLRLAAASPYLALFAAIWAAGEIAGYIAGPGNALAEIE